MLDAWRATVQRERDAAADDFDTVAGADAMHKTTIAHLRALRDALAAEQADMVSAVNMARAAAATKGGGGGGGATATSPHELRKRWRMRDRCPTKLRGRYEHLLNVLVGRLVPAHDSNRATELQRMAESPSAAANAAAKLGEPVIAHLEDTMDAIAKKWGSWFDESRAMRPTYRGLFEDDAADHEQHVEGLRTYKRLLRSP
jgi:hypothetical protein